MTGPIPPGDLERFAAEWRRCQPWIQGALAWCGGTHAIEDVAAAVVRGDAQFWAFERSALVSEFCVFPRLTAFHHWLVGGDLKDLLSHREAVEAWALSTEPACRRFTTAGREGWRRVMGRHGYSPIWNVCVKDIT